MKTQSNQNVKFEGSSLAASVAKSFVKKASKKVEAPVADAPQKTVISDLLKYQGLFKKAQALYTEDEAKVVDYFSKNRECTYFVTMLQKGTHSDKISALSMLIQKNPARSIGYLQQLIGLCRKHNRKQAEPAFLALRDVFGGHILQDGQKLTAFQYNPHIQDKTENIANFDLIEAYQQHCVKEIYRDFVTNILVDLSKDDIEYYRKLALDILVDLMSKKPEIEEVILSILINKLGDSSKKIQGHTIQVLCKLLKDHPIMSGIVIQETHSLLQRQGLKTQQKFYACTFLNKIGVVCGQDPKCRISLFRVYFYMFRNILKNPAERKELVFVKDRTKSKKQQVQEKKKAALKMKQIKQNGDIDQDENKIVEQILKGVNVLMIKSKTDIRLNNHHGTELKKLLDEEMNTLFKLTHHNVFRIQIQVFKLLLQFAKVTQKMSNEKLEKSEEQGESKNFADRFYRTLYELLLKVHMSKATSLDDYFGLVFRAVKGDECVPRAIAFIKRLLQMCYLNECNFTAASLLVISELLKLRQDLRISLYTFSFGTTTVSKIDAGGSDEDEENFVDVDKVVQQNKPVESEFKKSDKDYDPWKREPKYANADSTQLFELASLCMHSHPTVRLWAQSLIDGKFVEYNGDPLLDFSITNFLDRIAYKDPKSKEKLAKFANKRATKMSDYEKPVNEYDFKAGERPAIERKEEEYIYKYLSQIDKKKKADVPSMEGDSDADEISDPEMEAFADNEIKKEMKRLQGEQASDDEEEVDVSYSDDEEVADEEDSNADGQAGNFTESEEDFFSDQEELEAVNDSEEEMPDEDDEDDMDGLGSDYGQEYDEEMDEQEEADSKKKKGKKVKGENDGFASYEDFAHLLEEGADEEIKKSKEKTYLKKRTHNEFTAAQQRHQKKIVSGVGNEEKQQRAKAFEMRKRGGEFRGRGSSPSRGGERRPFRGRGGERGSFRGNRGSSRGGSRGSSRGGGFRGRGGSRGRN